MSNAALVRSFALRAYQPAASRWRPGERRSRYLVPLCISSNGRRALRPFAVSSLHQMAAALETISTLKQAPHSRWACLDMRPLKFTFRLNCASFACVINEILKEKHREEKRARIDPLSFGGRPQMNPARVLRGVVHSTYSRRFFL